MTVNLNTCNCVPISALSVGDPFVSYATSDNHKGEKTLYMKIDMYSFCDKYKTPLFPNEFAVNLSTGYIRKFAPDFRVEPALTACVSLGDTCSL